MGWHARESNFRLSWPILVHRVALAGVVPPPISTKDVHGTSQTIRDKTEPNITAIYRRDGSRFGPYPFPRKIQCEWCSCDRPVELRERECVSMPIECSTVMEASVS